MKILLNGQKSSVEIDKKISRLPRGTVIGLLFGFLLLLLSSPSRADSPTDQVRATVNQVLAIVKNAKQNSSKNLQSRLVQVISPRFDFVEMARRSLGGHWGQRTPEEQREFTEVFTGLLGVSYAGNIGALSGQTVLYKGEVTNQNYSEVATEVVTDSRDAMSVNYKLHLVNQEWKVYDLVIEDISLVSSYRSQFNRVISRSSFTDLVRMMKEKQS